MPSRSLATWNALSPKYRGRLERRGITANYYTSGGSLAGARGHATTPERPSRAAAHPERYPEYTAKRAAPPAAPDPRSLSVDTVTRHALRIFGAGIAAGQIERFDALNVREHVRVAPRKVRRRMLDLTMEQWQNLARLTPEGFAAEFDIDDWELDVNPFFYH